MAVLFVDSHEEIVPFIKEPDLLHLDFHCDQRGLVVNLSTNRVDILMAALYEEPDCGNWLARPLYRTRAIKRFCWVYPYPTGGVADDEVGTTVIYAARGDLAAQGVQLDSYSVLPDCHWEEILAHEWTTVSLDWDFVAAEQFSRSVRKQRALLTQEILLRVRPKTILFARSWDWVALGCEPELRRFERFLLEHF